MSDDELRRALADVRRLCPPSTVATIERALRRPAGGTVLGAVEVQRASGAGDPRAEREERPRRKSTDQVASVVREKRRSESVTGLAAVTAELRRQNDAREREE